MVGTIRPVVYRDRQLLRWSIAAHLHLLGNVVAATSAGFFVGLIGYLVIPVTLDRRALLLGGLGILSIAYALDETETVHLPYPQRVAQVPASWRAIFHPYVTALLYGLGLGAGINTRIVTGALYVVLGGVFLAASPLYAAMSFGLFGLGRGASVLIAGWYMRNLHSGEELDPELQRFGDRSDLMHMLTGLTLAALGGYWCISLLLS